MAKHSYFRKVSLRSSTNGDLSTDAGVIWRRRMARPVRCALFLGLFTLFAGCGDGIDGGSQLALPLGPTAELSGQEQGKFFPARLLVKFRDGREQAGQRLAEMNYARIAGEIPQIGVKIIELPEQASEVAHLRAFRQWVEVESAELDVAAPPALLPDDPYYFPAAGLGWQLPQIGAPAAWDITTGSSDVIIAVLDTGCDPTHPDLASKYVPGWNFYDDNDDTTDVMGHGTHVAGVAAATGNNGLGVASLAWGCRIMPLRISDTAGGGYVSMIANGLIWAADHGARVANISYIMSNSPTVTSAAQYFQSQGGVVTISAGNYSVFDSSPDNPYALTISATDQNDVVPSWSNTGNNIDVAAPGVSIYSTAKDGGYNSGSGTSASAPLVAGAAALVLSANPTLDGPQIQDVLKQSADDLGPAGWDTSYGWGRLNVAHAVNAALDGVPDDTTPPSVSFSTPNDGATVGGDVVASVSADDDVGVESVALYIDDSLWTTDFAAPYEFDWNTLAHSNGMHTLRVVAGDAAGNSAAQEISVDVFNASDTTAPTVTITSPTGGMVRNKLNVKASASDDVGVIRVELYVDDFLRDADTNGRYSFSEDTRHWPGGPHILQCKAYDAAGNVGLSATVTVYK